jgi:hypothetical protein
MAHMYIHHISITIHFSFLHIFHSSWQAGCPRPFASATTLPRDFWTHDFGGRSGPHGRSCQQNQKLPTPSGYQTASTFSWHGRLLPPLSAKLRASFTTSNQSSEGRGQNVGVDRFHSGGIPKCQAPPGGGSSTPTPCPQR